MTRPFITLAVLLAGVAPACAMSLADTPLSVFVERAPETSPEEKFVAAGAHFLRGVEIILQARYDAGLPGEMAGLPFMRLPVPENPSPVVPGPTIIKDTLTASLGEFSAARELLAGLDDEKMSAEVRLGDLWFDIDGSGTREPGEGVMEATTMMAPVPKADDDVVIAFDGTDAAWLDAYASLLSGTAQVILAYDPDPVLAEVASSRTVFQREAIAGQFFPDVFLDAAAVVIGTMKNEPDPVMMRKAHTSLLDVIRSNRKFLTLLANETGDDREWIPKDGQDVVFGRQILERALPNQEIGMVKGLTPRDIQAWSAVLDDAEALLRGEKLLPFWRSSKGIDMSLSLIHI